VRKINLVVLFLVLVQNFLFAAQPLRSETSEIATNFTLLDLEHKEFSLSDLKGKPVILFFWTSWCPYCRRELRLLNSLKGEFLQDGVELVAINVEESVYKVQKFMGNYPFSYRILLDRDAEVARAFGILGVPTYILINKQGRIVFEHNYFPEKEYKDLMLNR